MDAAQKLYKNTGLFLLTALALAVPASAQIPAFNLSANSVTLNQSVTSGVVTVSSSGTAISFRASISYAVDGGSGIWLRFSQGVTSSTDLATPKSLGVEIASVAGSTIGLHQATVTLTPINESLNSGVQPITFDVNWT